MPHSSSFVLRELLADHGAVYLVVLGTVAILVMVFSRKRLWGLVEARFDWSLLPTRRHRS